jgi:predicted dehydrogenase
MSEKICKWGILSTASIAEKNWLAIRNSGNGVVAGVASRSAEKAQAFIDRCQSTVPFESVPTAFASYEELLASDDIDAVYIPIPTGLRKEWVIKAANAGKHVLAEKPAARDAGEVQEMLDACAVNNVQYMDGVMYMHSGRLPALREALDDPSNIGDIKRISTNFSFAADASFLEENIRMTSDLEPMGCLGDLGWYTSRMILWIMEYEMPEQVVGRLLTAQSRDDSPEPVPVEFSAEFFYPNGVSASYYNSFITENQQWVNIAGSKGYIYIPDFVLPFVGNEVGFDINQSRFKVDGCDFNMEKHVRHVAVDEYGGGHKNAQESYLFRNFSEIVLSDNLDPLWGELTLKTQKLLDAALASAQNNSLPVMV